MGLRHDHSFMVSLVVSFSFCHLKGGIILKAYIFFEQKITNVVKRINKYRDVSVLVT